MRRVEQQVVKSIQAADSTRELKWLCLDLAESKFEVEKMAEKARRARVSQRLGYLSEVTAVACRNSCPEAAARLETLAGRLYRPNFQWRHLDPNLPVYAKRIITSNAVKGMNQKWHIWGTLTPEELEDWLALYRVGD